MVNYLPFEEPLSVIDEEIEKAREIEENSGVDTTNTVKELEKSWRKQPKRSSKS